MQLSPTDVDPTHREASTPPNDENDPKKEMVTKDVRARVDSVRWKMPQHTVLARLQCTIHRVREPDADDTTVLQCRRVRGGFSEQRWGDRTQRRIQTPAKAVTWVAGRLGTRSQGQRGSGDAPQRGNGRTGR
ncbi:hypothetical protein EVG20_g9144 [Dentipellis fragilis]|uniref:Uncharacterized protein n=1 Tax=Dentipellis fragilis TaxID=205917 RepID=A0A4Y9Y1G0_9AGAM|nr:hypothetical protein EVG20_g9144 [Dentipellis fragilis]